MHHRVVTDQHIFARNINGCVCMHACMHLAFKDLNVPIYGVVY